jgi:uncharacterized peroxidase-related enzyme
MAWIKTIDESEAKGELQKLYEQVKNKRGKLANIMKIQSLNPKAMKAHMDLYMRLMFGKSGLSRQEREIIAVVVSAANGCEYCINHHAQALDHYWKDEAKLNALIADPKSLDLSERVDNMIDYVVQLTTKPSELTSSQINRLKDTGFSDEDILNINMIAAYFNFVNRIALGLGVEFTPDEIEGYKV